MKMQRPADEIEAGDVIEYTAGGLMLVTIPGREENLRFVGRRVGHHGVILTVPDGDLKGRYRVGRVMASEHTPRQKVTVWERRAYERGEPCPCDFHRRRRGEEGEAVFPPVVAEPETQAPAVSPAQRPTLPAVAAVAAPVEAEARHVLMAQDGKRACLAAELPYAIASRVRLGEGWTVGRPVHCNEAAAYLVHADGRRLKVERDGRRGFEESHVRVSVEYPAGAPVQIFDRDRPETRFKADRPASELAGQIMRRILPVYSAKYAEVAAALAKARQADAVGRSLSDRVAAWVPGGRVQEHNSAYVDSHPFPGEIEQMHAFVSPVGDHRVEFRYVDTATLETLVQVYGQLTRAKMARREAAGRGAEVSVR